MARTEGDIIIARTKVGGVNLTYGDGTYKLTRFGGEVLYEGKAKGCRKVIASLYDVVMQELYKGGERCPSQ